MSARAPAQVFAALGDPSRLRILEQVSRSPASASALGPGLDISRQAAAKHLRVLEDAGLVRAERAGREVVYRVRPEGVARPARWLDDVAAGWERRLTALKQAAEQDEPGRRGSIQG